MGVKCVVMCGVKSVVKCAVKCVVQCGVKCVVVVTKEDRRHRDVFVYTLS